jgi:hypothetical protein
MKTDIKCIEQYIYNSYTNQKNIRTSIEYTDAVEKEQYLKQIAKIGGAKKSPTDKKKLKTPSKKTSKTSSKKGSKTSSKKATPKKTSKTNSKKK